MGAKVLKTTLVVAVIVAVMAPAFVLAVGGSTSSGVGATQGDSIVQFLKDLATGSFGKALFFIALLVGVCCLLFTKHRMFGMSALAFGFLLGAYGGLAEQFWTFFTSLGSGSKP